MPGPSDWTTRARSLPPPEGEVAGQRFWSKPLRIDASPGLIRRLYRDEHLSSFEEGAWNVDDLKRTNVAVVVELNCFHFVSSHRANRFLGPEAVRQPSEKRPMSSDPSRTTTWVRALRAPLAQKDQLSTCSSVRIPIRTAEVSSPLVSIKVSAPYGPRSTSLTGPPDS